MAMDPTGAVFTVPFNPAFGAVPNVTLTMDAADGGLPSKTKLTLTGRTSGQFTARVSAGTIDPLTTMSQIILDDGVSGWSSLAVVNGNPAVSYYDDTNGNLKYVRAADASGSSWGVPVTIDSSGSVGQYATLALVNGSPAISYYDDTNDDLKFVRATDATGSTWGTPVVIDSSGSVGQQAYLAVVSGNPAICYIDSTNGKLKYARAANSNGTSWSAPVQIDNADNWPTSLLVVNGNPAISYRNNSNSGKYIRSNDPSGTGWGTPVAVGGDIAGSMVIVNGRPAVCAYNGARYVRANDADGTSWGALINLPTTAGSLAVINGYPSILSEGKYMRSLDADGAMWGDYVHLTNGSTYGLTALALVDSKLALVSVLGGKLNFIRTGASQPFNVLWMALEP
jgi:hypothetical protein